VISAAPMTIMTAPASKTALGGKGFSARFGQYNGWLVPRQPPLGAIFCPSAGIQTQIRRWRPIVRKSTTSAGDHDVSGMAPPSRMMRAHLADGGEHVQHGGAAISAAGRPASARPSLSHVRDPARKAPCGAGPRSMINPGHATLPARRPYATRGFAPTGPITGKGPERAQSLSFSWRSLVRVVEMPQRLHSENER
jgi:hypothetical protein